MTDRRLIRQTMNGNGGCRPRRSAAGASRELIEFGPAHTGGDAIAFAADDIDLSGFRDWGDAEPIASQRRDGSRDLALAVPFLVLSRRERSPANAHEPASVRAAPSRPDHAPLPVR